jgi:REP element-mobilizing transposase RayT
MYWRRLPHWRQHGATYFVTFRLADSLPKARLRELELAKQAWVQRHGRGSVPGDFRAALQDRIPRARWPAFTRAMMAKVESWLDEGIGECWMKRPDVSQLVESSLDHVNGDQCELGCYVVMPNHVHAILRPLDPEVIPLEKILQGCKRQASREINALVGRSGTLWQEESFNRIIRDEEHLYRCMQYIGRNPRTAGLTGGEFRTWVRPAWEALGWWIDEA